MSLQKDIFLQDEADRYWKRNREKLSNVTSYDPVMSAIATIGLSPKVALEIGCANGWRLNAIKQKYQTLCYGIDPSADAIHEGQLEYPDVILRQATADYIPFDDQIFDVVVFGFCLYLCDRRDLHKIAYEADRVLGEGGHVAILDFAPPFPYQNSYKHREGIFSFKMRYANMFLWNPAYTIIYDVTLSHGIFSTTQHNTTQHNTTQHNIEPHPDDRLGITILRKSSKYAYSHNTFA